MNKMEFLKCQHLSMFAEKRRMHKSVVCALYEEYLRETPWDESNTMLLFSHFYQFFADRFPKEIYEGERIVGTNWHWRWQGEFKGGLTPGNLGHYTADFKDFLKKGISGKLETVRFLTPQTEKQRNDQIGFETALTAFATYIRNHGEAARKAADEANDSADKSRLLTIADDCMHLAEKPPVNFRQALQFVWFIQCFLETEAGNAAISFGRADEYLYPYYRRDVDAGALTAEEALELIMCFYIKISEGDESTMLTVGGDVENELSFLMVEAQTRLNMRQPSIAVRVSPATSDELLNKTVGLVMNGSGMPAYFNDDVITAGLKRVGIDEESARDYGVVGCYESAPQGSFSNTVAGSFDLFKPFHHFLGQQASYSSFEEFLAAYKADFEEYYVTKIVPAFQKKLNELKSQISPFASCALKGWLEKGIALGNTGGDYYLFGFNILGIGLLIDSIHTVKKLVFETQYTTIGHLLAQAKQDFPDLELYAKIKGIPTYYGSNSEESNLLARELSQFIGEVIARHPLEEGVLAFPALFAFTADIAQRDFPGTVNGRKQGELISYGVMPCATPHEQKISSMLLSCANIAAEYFPDGCPAMITLNRRDIEKPGVLAAVLRTYFSAGGYHLAINTVNADLLKEAIAHPEEHSDIMVKISGYSAKFVTLSDSIQTAVVERAERGM